jgi:hypothetical protein
MGVMTAMPNIAAPTRASTVRKGRRPHRRVITAPLANLPARAALLDRFDVIMAGPRS